MGQNVREIKKSQEHRMKITEMHMLRNMSRLYQKDRIRNNYIRGSLGVADIRKNVKDIGYGGLSS